MSTPTRQHIYIYDHPESRIRFLETTLAGEDWMATVVIPPAQAENPQSFAQSMEEELKAKGFATSTKQEADGTVALTLHHPSKHTSPIDMLQEVGLVKGTGFAIGHVGTNLLNLVSNATHTIEYLVKEPARLFSTVYMMGDAFYSFSSWSSKDPHAEKKPFTQNFKEAFSSWENILQNASGWAALSQSGILMFFANNGGELNARDLNVQFKRGEKLGIDAMNVKGWTAPEMNKPLLGSFDTLARKNPIDVGSWTQIAGQLMLAGSSALTIKNNSASFQGAKLSDCWQSLRTKEPPALPKGQPLEPHIQKALDQKKALGSGINIARAGVAITAWMMLMKPAKEGEVTSSWAHPLERIKQEIDFHPERAAGLINSLASVIGLTASYIKQNHNTIAAESIWLFGDVIMMFAKKAHYGGAAANNEIPLIDAATKFLQAMPIAVSESQRAKMVDELALYLAKKSIDDKTTTAEARTAPVNEEIETLKHSIVAGVNANLSMLNHAFDRVNAASAILVERFPPQEREAVVNKLAHGLAAAPGIYASQEEIREAILSRVDMKAGFGIDKPTMSLLARDIAQLVTASPPIANAGVVVAVHDAIDAAMQHGAHDKLLLDRAMEQEQAKPPTELPKTHTHVDNHAVKNSAGTSHAERVRAEPQGTPIIA